MQLKREFRQVCVSLLLSLLLAGPGMANPGTLTVKVNEPGVKISPMIYGLMTEEINHSYDGGLYAELIQNRIFKNDPNKPVHWSVVSSEGAQGAISLDTSDPVNTTALTTSLKLDITTVGKGQRVGVANDGYWGIPVKPDTRYRASFYARASARFLGPLTVDVESSDGTKTYAHARVQGIGQTWKHYAITLRTGRVKRTADARFVISAEKPGTVWLNLVSLFPPTYDNQPNGDRIDLMQLLGAMKPSFLRLPGGNYLEGNSIAERFNWKATIHDISQRPGHESPWGYRSTDGMGLLEYLEWCEDLHMEAVLAVYAGYSLNTEHVAPGPDLQPYVQDALDEIEYVIGPQTSTWGAQRVADGHPAPFPLHYVEISNEDGGFNYDGRYAQFYDAIKAKYPDLQVIATSRVTSRTPDVVDDHYYRSAAAMERDVHHYDNYPRTGPKIFVGEWASTEGSPTPTLQAALGDAAWMTGLERNSDLVVMASYAPLLVNVNPGGAEWGTNLIGYNALTSYGSPSYYAQKMFSNNRGDVVLPVDVVPQASAEPAPPGPSGAIGVGTWVTQAEYKDIKVTHDGQTLYEKNLVVGAGGWALDGGVWKAQDGVLRQTGTAPDCRATVGDKNWTDYTYEVKARKISGAEGFLILFHVKDHDNFIWWNIGGWGNSHTALEQCIGGGKEALGEQAPVTVETGRWYAIKIEVKGTDIRCYLDDKLITEATDNGANPPSPIFATASLDKKAGDVILKVVNVSGAAQSLNVQLQGAHSVGATATGEVLQGQPGDQNSIEEPEKDSPKPLKITGVGPAFVYEFPPYSVSVIRVKAR